ncbi:MAG: beta-propeller fold lactonase family protein [Terrimonas sp.]|nr:beta-propeller fold lactonase family protein [Terrimonas sp.]
MKNLTLFSLMMFSLVRVNAQQKEYFMLVGTYTRPGMSEGIYVYKFDTETGKSEAISTVPASNPSYLAVSPDEKFVYAVNEDKPGNITAFSFDKQSGQLSVINQQPSGGDHPCYITVDKTGKWVIAGNYSSGSATLFPVEKNGALGDIAATLQDVGYSVNSDRQEGPHVHSTVLSPDNNFLFTPDLGTDKVMIYSFDDRKGALKPAKIPYVETEAGSGPRHFIFHPRLHVAYLIEELTGSISVYGYSKGVLNLLQNISSQPLDYLGTASGADIHISPDGNFLYASNRAQSNTIGIFAIHPENGTLTLFDHQSTMGETPRNFSIDPSGNFLLVANQDSNEIVVFTIDKASGALSDSGERINLGKPVCIKWISTQ